MLKCFRLIENITFTLFLVVVLAGALPTAAQERGSCPRGETLVVRLAGSPYDGPRDAR